MPTKLESIPITRIRSFNSLIAELEKLEQQLPTRLDQFVVFNKAYLIITKAIMNAAKTDYFQNPKFIEQFTVSFAHNYLNAINQTVTKSSDLPIAWQDMNKAGRSKSTPQFVLLLMGANAHINHDLPITLNKLISDKKRSGLLKDVLKIDKLLLISGRKILKSFDEPKLRARFLKRKLVWLYYYPVMYLVLYWRIKAWRNYKKIELFGAEQSNYQKTSEKTAKRFLRVWT